jgi:metal-responsive CopG/Arc/MetJ family transcriptional regulator
MEIDKIIRFTNNKTKMVGTKFNPEFLEIIDRAVLELKMSSRAELIDTALMKFLEEKGYLK